MNKQNILGSLKITHWMSTFWKSFFFKKKNHNISRILLV